ncbi:MAG: ATP-dependent helicase [Solirubrobacteraceae bacterium]
MSTAPNGLLAIQCEAARHRGSPLLLHGPAGTGKTRALIARFAWLLEQGDPPESVLVLAPNGAGADRLRSTLEDVVERPYERLAVHSVSQLCAELLGHEAAAAGLDPFAVLVAPSDRLALLLERVGELELRFHDSGGQPAALLAGVIERIDLLKAALVGADAFAAWAEALPRGEAAERSRADREREFAALYRAHDRILAEHGALDEGDQLLRTRALLIDSAHVAQRAATRYRHLLVDELPDLSYAQLDVICRLTAGHRSLWATGDPDQAITRLRGAAARNAQELRARFPDLLEMRLERSLRCPQRVMRAAHAVVAPVTSEPEPLASEGVGEVSFWRCSSERAQAQTVAAELERLIGRGGVAPEDCCVLVRSVRREGATVAVALEERAVPHSVIGGASLFQRPEVRDVLAWLRLLVDPADAGAAVRALARPPIELRAIDLARCTQIARRRKLDMVSALAAATESPQLPPEARERVLRFLKLHRSAAAALDTTRPDLFVHRLIERLGVRRQQLFSAQPDVVERLVSLARFAELAATFVRRSPQATPREFARYVAAVAEAGLQDRDDGDDGERTAGGVRVMAMAAAPGHEFECVFVLGLQSARIPGARSRPVEPIPDALLSEQLPADTRDTHVAEMRRLVHVAMTRSRARLVLAHVERSGAGAAQPPSPFAEEARRALGAEWEPRGEELFGPAESIHASFRAARDELLESVGRVGGRLGELRFDTDLDVAHAVVRYLELLKLAALLERPAGQSLADALPEINARLALAATAQQREIIESSPLDEYLLDAERDERRRAQVVASAAEPSLLPFLPTRGEGLVLSASDIDAYRTCPLRYKFARVFRIPQEPTVNQRFGILVHQVLERFHGGAAASGGGGNGGGTGGGGGSGGGTGGRAGTLAELLGLLDAGWRRSGFGGSGEERQLRAKATAALSRYHERFEVDPSEPMWFERTFAFRLGPHWLRGRVDRVDRLPDGGYELIDYKTGRPKTAAQLRDDVQLTLYAMGAHEAWDLQAARGSYYYVLDDEKVAVPHNAEDREWIEETVHTVADGILGQGFEPTPSYAACSACDFRIACPAAER